MLISALNEGIINPILRSPEEYSPAFGGEVISKADMAGLLALDNEHDKAEAEKSGRPARTVRLDPDEEYEDEAPAVEADDDSDADPEDESTSEEDDAGADEPTSEDDKDNEDEAGLPPIDPPASFNKEEKEAFKGWPRSLQESVAKRIGDRDAQYNKRFMEVGEAEKAAKAIAAQAEVQRDQYAQAINHVAAQVRDYISNEFADVKTQADLDRMAEEDPLRFNRWQRAKEKAIDLHNEQTRLSQEQAAINERKFVEYVQTESAKFREAVPEIVDEKKGPALQAGVRSLLVDTYGISDNELQPLFQGKHGISIHDSRVQRIIYDAYRYRQAQKAISAKPDKGGKKVPSGKPAPKVMQPGTTAPKGEKAFGRIQALNKELSATGSRDAYFELMKAQEAAARKRR